MGSVDNRIVNMQFNNREFEKNINTSINSLDNLKKSMDFKGTEKNFDEVVKSTGVFGNAVDEVKMKFSALDIMAITALTRITNAAIDTGVRFAKALSTDQIVAGWDKLEKKATSMSTLVSQGFDLDVVEKQVEKLNWFSDETSYNFTDMVDNVAKFTATGKGLEDSVTALEGIALWAAKSGQNATTASRAMYQLSQAMGSGVMRREDWKSISNVNMDTAEFRKVALETAVELGTLKKVGNDTYKSLVAGSKKGAEEFKQSQFIDSLTEGLWFTDKVMMSIYEKYGRGAEQVKSIVDTMDKDFNTEIWTSTILDLYKALNSSEEAFYALSENKGFTDEMTEKLKEMISGLDEFGVKALRAGQEYRTFTDAIDSTKDAVSTKWMNIFSTILGNLEEQKELWTNVGDSLYSIFVTPLTELDNKLQRWVELGRTF